MKVKFVKDHKVQQHDGKGPLYKAGEVYNFDGFTAESYAQKYIRLGYAVEHVNPIMVTPEEVAPNFSAPADAPVAAETVAAADVGDVKFGFRRGPGRPRKGE